MSWVSILIIGLVVAMIVGPIMLMQPSPRERNLAKLRTQASQLGLRVRMVTFQGQTLASYEKPWPLPESARRHLGTLRLERAAYAHELHLSQYWQVADGVTVSDALRPLLEPALTELPAGVSAVEITPNGVSCLWNELGGEATLQALSKWLSHSDRLMVPTKPQSESD
jgi:hypothetical protein